MYLQNVDNVYSLAWNESFTYGDIQLRGEVEHSHYNFEDADIEMLFKLFEMYERESKRVVEMNRVLPAYELCLKCSHVFNLLDARGAVGVNERTNYIHRVRVLAQACARCYLGVEE
jgi:glycyl-tRNA synthetase alpha chain